MGRKGRKRSHAQYASDTRPGSNEMGIGTTLAHIRNPELAELTVNDEESGSGEWEVVSRNNKQKKTNYPSLAYSLLHNLQSCVRLGDLQSLILYCLADATSPQWISVRHHNMVKKAVVLFVPGLEMGMFNGRLPLGTRLEDQVITEAQAPNTNSSETAGLVESSTQTPTNRSNGNSIHGQMDQTASSTARNGPSPEDYLPTELQSAGLPEALKPLEEVFEFIWPIKTPGDDRFGKVHSPLQAMLQSPVTKTQEWKGLERDMKGPKPATGAKHFENKRTPIPTFISSTEDLQENEYILHPANVPKDGREHVMLRRVQNNQAKDHGWVDTLISEIEDGSVPEQEFEHGSLSQGREVLAMDCEMCRVEGGEQALTRISLVGWDGSTVMDELVKPELPIIDYLTPFSGMTAEKLDPVTTNLAQIQRHLLTLLTPRTILVGHSLNADLLALRLTHPFIIDTALLYPHPRGPPLKSSLKWLAQKYLGREIQRGHGSTGHNSIEDAIACLDLVKMKGEKGPTWGTSDATNESVFKRLKRASAPGANRGGEAGTGRTGAIIDHGHPERNFGQMASYCIGCDSDSQVVDGVKRAVLGDDDGRYIPGGGVDFTWARLRELEILRGWRNDDPTATSSQPDPEPETLAKSVTQTVTYIKQIRDLLPPCTLLVVYSGTGDPRDMARLQEMQRRHKREFKVKKWDELSVKWTDVEEQTLKAAVQKARMGLGLFTIT